MNEKHEKTDDKQEPSSNRRWQDIITSDYVLGTLVVLFTITTALAAYLGSITDIRGDDLDLRSQNKLILATTTFLQTSVELSEDILTYQSFQLLKDRDPTAAAMIFELASLEMQARLSSESNPFDDDYRAQFYQEAFTIFEEAREFQEGADEADEQSKRYGGAAFVLTIGLAITAWASLYDSRPQLRLTFTLIALPCLAVGALILVGAVVSTF